MTTVPEQAEKRSHYGPNDLLTPAAAAQIATRSVRTIRRAYSAGRLTAYRDRSGRGVRIRYADLRDWLLGEELGELARVVRDGPVAPTPVEAKLALLRAARDSRRR